MKYGITAAICALAMVVTGSLASADVADFESGHLEVSDDLSMYYETSGHGPTPIVFVPGWTMSSTVFEKQRDYFQDSDRFTFFSYDPRGQGRSSKPVEGHTYAQHGRDLNAFLQGFGLTDIVLVGWSFGTLDVTAYLDQFGSDNLKALVIIDGTPKTTRSDSTKDWAWVGEDNWFDTNKLDSMELLTDKRLKNVTEFSEWMLENPTPQELKWSVDISLQTPGWIMSLTNASATAEDYEAALKELDPKLPVLFIIAENHWHPAFEDWKAKNMPWASYASFGHHLMFWQRSEQFNGELEKFLGTFK